MNPLNTFRQLIQGGTGVVTSGTVLAVGETTLRVTTTQGVKEYPVANPLQYVQGDYVSIQGSLLVGKAPSEGSIPVYNV